jgi:hypothetical protein
MSDPTAYFKSMREDEPRGGHEMIEPIWVNFNSGSSRLKCYLVWSSDQSWKRPGRQHGATQTKYRGTGARPQRGAGFPGARR